MKLLTALLIAMMALPANAVQVETDYGDVCKNFAKIHFNAASNDILKIKIIKLKDQSLTCSVEGKITVRDFTGITKEFKKDTLEVNLKNGTYKTLTKKPSFYKFGH